MSKSILPHHLIDTLFQAKSDDLLMIYYYIQQILENRGVL